MIFLFELSLSINSLLLIADAPPSECNLRQFINPLLKGVIVYVRQSDQHSYKQRRLTLHPSLLKFSWISLKSNKNGIAELSLEHITVFHSLLNYLFIEVHKVKL